VDITDKMNCYEQERRTLSTQEAAVVKGYSPDQYYLGAIHAWFAGLCCIACPEAVGVCKGEYWIFDHHERKCEGSGHCPIAENT
jgi:hypothetical protein